MLKNKCIICKKKFEGLIVCSEKCEEELTKIITITTISGIIIEIIEKLEKKE